MSKTLSWLTAGLVAVLIAGLMLATATRKQPANASAASEVTELTQQLAQLEASQQAYANEHAELTGEIAALQDQIVTLTHALDRLANQQANAAEPIAEQAIDAPPQPPATTTFQNDTSELAAAAPVPSSLRGMATTPGEVFIYEVTGTTGGSVWGTDIYTDDSSLAAAAVHAGLLRPDETGTIMVTVVAGRDTYRGSARNGVASKDYPGWERSFTLQRLQ